MSTPYYDLASLVVVPSGYKAAKVYAQKPLTTDGQLAFTRASTATRVNASGLIEAVASGVPRLDYLGSTCPRLLLEPQRSNLVTYSEQLNTGTGGTSTVTPNTVVSPDGTTNGDTIGTGYLSKSVSATAGTYTMSVFIKYQSSNAVLLYIYDGAYYQGSFNPSTGVATTSTGSPTVSMVSYGNGWWKCFVTATTANNISEIGFGSGNAYAYGLSLEAGAYATSYIPTLGASVTRVADACSKTGISSLIGQTAGTIYAEWNSSNVAASGRVLAIGDGTFANRIVVLEDAGNVRVFISTSSVVQADLSPLGSYVGTHKIAIAYANNDLKVYIDGVAVATQATLSVPVCSVLYVGTFEDGTGTTPLGGRIAQTLLFKTRLTNAQLAELTAL